MSVAFARFSRPHHAWWIVLAAGLVMFVQGGLGSYAFGVLLPAWVSDMGWSRSAISVVYVIGTLLPGLTGALVGRWTDTIGPRWLIVAGASITAGSYILLSTVNSFAAFFLVFVIGAIGRCGTSPVPVSAAVTRWFASSRGLAMGLVNTGVSAAGVIGVPVATWLVVSYGWRATVIVLGVVMWLAVVPLVWNVMDRAPSDRGMQPYGIANAVPSKMEATLGTAVRGPLFWLCAGMFLLGSSSTNAIGIHALPAIIDKGAAPTEGALVISLMAFCSLSGKLIFGRMADRFPPTLVFGLALVLEMVGYVLLALVPAGIGMWIFAITFGLSLGGVTTLQSVVVADIFGVAAYGLIFGAISTPVAVFSSISPVYTGAVRDATGTYATAFLSFGVLSAIGAALSLVTYFYSRKVARRA